VLIYVTDADTDHMKVVITYDIMMHKIGKYDKEIGEKSGNYQQNRNFHIVSIDTESVLTLHTPLIDIFFSIDTFLVADFLYSKRLHFYRYYKDQKTTIVNKNFNIIISMV